MSSGKTSDGMGRSQPARAARRRHIEPSYEEEDDDRDETYQNKSDDEESDDDDESSDEESGSDDEPGSDEESDFEDEPPAAAPSPRRKPVPDTEKDTADIDSSDSDTSSDDTEEVLAEMQDSDGAEDEPEEDDMDIDSDNEIIHGGLAPAEGLSVTDRDDPAAFTNALLDTNALISMFIPILAKYAPMSDLQEKNRDDINKIIDPLIVKDIKRRIRGRRRGPFKPTTEKDGFTEELMDELSIKIDEIQNGHIALSGLANEGVAILHRIEIQLDCLMDWYTHCTCDANVIELYDAVVNLFKDTTVKFGHLYDEIEDSMLDDEMEETTPKDILEMRHHELSQLARVERRDAKNRARVVATGERNTAFNANRSARQDEVEHLCYNPKVEGMPDSRDAKFDIANPVWSFLENDWHGDLVNMGYEKDNNKIAVDSECVEDQDVYLFPDNWSDIDNWCKRNPGKLHTELKILKDSGLVPAAQISLTHEQMEDLYETFHSARFLVNAVGSTAMKRRSGVVYGGRVLHKGRWEFTDGVGAGKFKHVRGGGGMRRVNARIPNATALSGLPDWANGHHSKVGGKWTRKRVDTNGRHKTHEQAQQEYSSIKKYRKSVRMLREIKTTRTIMAKYDQGRWGSWLGEFLKTACPGLVDQFVYNVKWDKDNKKFDGIPSAEKWDELRESLRKQEKQCKHVIKSGEIEDPVARTNRLLYESALVCKNELDEIRNEFQKYDSSSDTETKKMDDLCFRIMCLLVYSDCITPAIETLFVGDGGWSPSTRSFQTEPNWEPVREALDELYAKTTNVIATIDAANEAVRTTSEDGSIVRTIAMTAKQAKSRADHLAPSFPQRAFRENGTDPSLTGPAFRTQPRHGIELPEVGGGYCEIPEPRKPVMSDEKYKNQHDELAFKRDLVKWYTFNIERTYPKNVKEIKSELKRLEEAWRRSTLGPRPAKAPTNIDKESPTYKQDAAASAKAHDLYRAWYSKKQRIGSLQAEFEHSMNAYKSRIEYFERKSLDTVGIIENLEREIANITDKRGKRKNSDSSENIEKKRANIADGEAHNNAVVSNNAVAHNYTVSSAVTDAIVCGMSDAMTD
jgi:hypothetical protein